MDKKKKFLTVMAILFCAVLITGTAYSQVTGSDTPGTGTSSKAGVDLRSAMRQLWEDHIHFVLLNDKI
jgi:hypothetical protein